MECIFKAPQTNKYVFKYAFSSIYNSWLHSYMEDKVIYRKLQESNIAAN